MRKFSIILVLAAIFVFMCVCSTNSEESKEKPPVVISLAEDDSVNGYRENPKNSNKISADDVVVGTTPTVNNSTSDEKYCGNKNSKVLHKNSCGSVSKMKDANKVFYKSKEEALNQGYKPCGSCKP